MLHLNTKHKLLLSLANNSYQVVTSNSETYCFIVTLPLESRLVKGWMDGWMDILSLVSFQTLLVLAAFILS